MHIRSTKESKCQLSVMATVHMSNPYLTIGVLAPSGKFMSYPTHLPAARLVPTTAIHAQIKELALVVVHLLTSGF